MPDEVVLDASVALKIFLDEEGSDAARQLVVAGARFVAPALVVAEVANVLIKRLRRAQMTTDLAFGVLDRTIPLFDELVRIESLAQRAMTIAVDLQLSAYDALYATLAELRQRPLATADLRLAERIARSNLAVELWTP
jgi:predicted nucleic acid-binding protein